MVLSRKTEIHYDDNIYSHERSPKKVHLNDLIEPKTVLEVLVLQ